VGDVITHFGGEAVDTPYALQAVVERAPIGSQQKLSIFRNGKPVQLAAKLHEQPTVLVAVKGKGVLGS
jgi:S1-C subfamily serine protease